MHDRALQQAIESLCFPGNKMAFVSGPRQCGKTTMAKRLLQGHTPTAYFNWDDTAFRREWVKNPQKIVPIAGPARPRIVLDEIHKARGWKRTLKGVYDTLEKPVDILVTGSARLTTYRKGSDSLSGRYFHFRLHPFTLHEMRSADCPSPEDAMTGLFGRRDTVPNGLQDNLEAILRYTGFPEPLFAQDERRMRMWRRNRIDTVIREDIRDLTRIHELSRIEMLVALLPERVGSLFSPASLRDDLEVSFDTVRRWVLILKDLYYLYEIKPYLRSIKRSLRKEGKVYLWDYGEIADGASRFENLVANHLLTACQRWSDSGEGDFDLFFVRNKDQQEIDFLITRDRKPWLPVEVKLRDTALSDNWRRFLPVLGCRQALQLVATPGIWRELDVSGARVIIASAAQALSCLP